MKESDYSRVEKAIRYLESHWQEQPSLEEVAKASGLSPFHFQRLFQRWAGVSPKRFLQYLSIEWAKKNLRDSRSVLDAAFDSGLSGPGRLHDLFVTVEAMTPGEYKAGGAGLRIAYGVHATPFGPALAAMTPRGLCGLWFLGKSGGSGVLARMKREWPRAKWIRDPKASDRVVQTFFERGPKLKRGPLQVLLKGTPFQLKVWEALLRIPEGSVASYQEVAKRIGKPKASRAVGTAVGANRIAYLIPCHRVIRGTGVMGDYRWGSARKKALLAWEGTRS